MEISKDTPPNCRGYAFFKLGFIDEEVFVFEGELIDFPFIEKTKNQKEAVAVGILMSVEDKILLKHIMVIDEDDPTFVWHRPDTGIDPKREQGAIAIAKVLDGLFYPHEIVLLKRTGSLIKETAEKIRGLGSKSQNR